MKQVKLNWAYEASESLLGFVVYSGEMASRLKPATGLIQTKSFTDKNAGKGTYYQVRAYAGSTIIYSAIVATEKNR